jgi:hypothetical protein
VHGLRVRRVLDYYSCLHVINVACYFSLPRRGRHNHVARLEHFDLLQGGIECDARSAIFYFRSAMSLLPGQTTVNPRRWWTRDNCCTERPAAASETYVPAVATLNGWLVGPCFAALPSNSSCISCFCRWWCCSVVVLASAGLMQKMWMDLHC